MLLNPHIPIQPWRGKPPEKAIAYEIRITAGNDIDIRCVGIEQFDVSSRMSIQTILENVAVGTNKFRKPKLYTPYRSDLSFQVKDSAYLIFKLANNKIQFSSSYPPFSIDKKYPDDLFGDATKIDAKGNAAGPNDNGCKVAYFIMDGAKAYSSHPNDLANGFSFNFHVDLVSRSSNGPDHYAPAYLPITIDPDIRHPGGNGP